MASHQVLEDEVELPLCTHQRLHDGDDIAAIDHLRVHETMIGDSD